MYIKRLLRSWLRLCLVLAATMINTITSSAANIETNVSNNNGRSFISNVMSQSDQYASFNANSLFGNEAHERNRRAVVQAPLRLIDEKTCPEIRNLCTNLRDGADDLPVLECIQTFLSNQIESLSDECQHAIWTHTGIFVSTESEVRLLRLANTQLGFSLSHTQQT